MQEFKEPEDIEQYGRMVGYFANTMKAVADIGKLSGRSAMIADIAGEGRFNSLDTRAEDYTRYGPKEMAAGQGKYAGLFGAFYFIHQPEVLLSKHAPTLLGEAHCQLETVVEGKTYRIPLNEVSFAFSNRVYTADDAGAFKDENLIVPGRITLRKDTVFTAYDGATITLAGGTPLTSEHITRVSDRVKRAKQAWHLVNGKAAFQIMDAHGKPLEEDAAVTMLWNYANAMGFKKYPRTSVEFKTLEWDGADDDFAAEAHDKMAEIVQAKQRH